MKNKDQILLESIYNLILEGKKETIDYLQKNNADQNTITLFTKQDITGKPLFPTDQAIIMFNWIKDNPVNLDDIETDYNNFKKYFPNKNLKDFKNYLNFSETVHGKVGEKEFENRNKDVGTIDVHGDDKENVIADDEDVLILKGDDEHKCVRYGKGYSFCISRPYGGNMYGNYRLSKESTFYFVYFKKVPKEDPKHIMVLDRTNDGWEWTFGENQTKVIEGGWDELIGQYPILAKYEKKFVNNPLNDEEKEYQEKLSNFSQNPTKEDFQKFSYKEKADVLKFGMEIPEDLFDSLDKFLRNEYVSVGPNIEENIFNKLDDIEKQRYIKVRKTILNQEEPKLLLDLEIVRNDPKLYEKYIKREEEYYNQFIKKYGDLEHDDEDKILYFNVKYFPLNLPQLQTSGNIDAYKAITINLPKLQTSGHIHASKAIEINLPQLQTSEGIHAPDVRKINLLELQKSGHIDAPSVTELNLPKLQTSGNINAYKARTINLPKLQTSWNISASNAIETNLPLLSTSKSIYVCKAIEIDLPQLQRCESINAFNATKINLPQLQRCESINAFNATEINLPQLQTSRNIDSSKAITINLPQLQTSGHIDARSAIEINLPKLQKCDHIYASWRTKKIIISKKLVSFLMNVKEHCEIIHPEEQEVKTESFKQYFNRI